LFEIKWDGVRSVAWIEDGKVKLPARAGSDITSQYPDLGGLPEAFSGHQGLIDGEIAVLDKRRHSDFGKLQERMHVRNPGQKLLSEFPVVYFAFDLLYCDGYDLQAAPLLPRCRCGRLDGPSRRGCAVGGSVRPPLNCSSHKIPAHSHPIIRTLAGFRPRSTCTSFARCTVDALPAILAGTA
jgi:hypothetical protein